MTSKFKIPYYKKTDPNTLMVTFDVTNLYCNIIYELEKQAITFWIENIEKLCIQDLTKNLSLMI